MITVLSTTQKGKELLARATNFEGEELFDVYESYSRKKAREFNKCRRMCEKEGGSDFRICSHNSYSFSVSWKIYKAWRMQTAHNSYLIELIE